MVLGADGTRLVEDPRLAFPCGQALLDLGSVVLSDTEAPGRVRDEDLFGVWRAEKEKKISIMMLSHHSAADIPRT